MCAKFKKACNILKVNDNPNQTCPNTWYIMRKMLVKDIECSMEKGYTLSNAYQTNPYSP